MTAVSFALFMLASLADAWTTHRFLTHRTAYEANPLLRWLFGRIGHRKGLVVKMVAALVVGVGSAYFDAWWLLLPLAGITGYAALRNWRRG